MPFGLIATLVLLAVQFLSPAELFPELAVYRPIVLMNAVAGLLSAFALLQFSFRSPQFFLMIGFAGSIILSMLGLGWLGGAIASVWEFSIFFVPFVLLSVNCTKLSHVKLAMWGLILTCLVICFQCLGALYFQIQYEKFIFEQAVWESPEVFKNMALRVRGLGFLNDPNDLGQVLCCVLPLVFLGWKPKNPLRGALTLTLAAVFILTIYHTQSRGAAVGMGILLLAALRNKFGNWVAILGIGGILLASVVVNFGGGREASLSEASTRGRIEAWSAGLTMLKSSPLWGVGYNKFTDHFVLTAHNSFVLCFAELGMIGYVLWLGILYVSFLQLNVLVQPASTDPEALELARVAALVRLSLLAFCTTGFFLSRTYEVTLYIVLALAVGLTEVERRRARLANVPSRLPGLTPKWFAQVVGIALASIVAFYGLARLRAVLG